MISFIFVINLNVNAQIIKSENDKIEFIGLENWTIQMIKDSSAIHAPNRAVGSCAIDLISIGFADACVEKYFEDGQYYTVVTILEPQYKDYVCYKSNFTDTLFNILEWEKGVTLFKKHPMEFQYSVINYGYILTNQIDSTKVKLPDWIDNSIIEEFWEFFKYHNKIEDKELALWILNNDGNYKNRIIATALLANFYSNNLTWWTLVDALRDNNPKVSTTAKQVLMALSNNIEKNINWHPVLHSIRHLLDGTNLFSFKTALKVLTKTNISPELSREIFKNGGKLILAYLKANHNEERDTAYNFLKTISGEDFGYDSKKWLNWINNLRQ